MPRLLPDRRRRRVRRPRSRRRTAGRRSHPKRSPPGSRRCTRCRCGCATRSSARSTCCAGRPAASTHADLTAAQALADVATIGILQHRAAEEARLLAEQLQYALNSRVTIEQAKGVLSERSGLDPETAFEALRRYARNHNERLVDVAEGVVRRTPGRRGDHPGPDAARADHAPARAARPTASSSGPGRMRARRRVGDGATRPRRESARCRSRSSVTSCCTSVTSAVTPVLRRDPRVPRAPGRVPGRRGVLDRPHPPRAAADRGRPRRDADPRTAGGSGCTTSA